MAMSQDHLAPSWLAAVSARRGVPVRAVLVTSGFMVACILVLDLELFVKAASAMLILLLILEILAMSVMRESRLASYQPSWRTPFYPWLHVAGLIGYAFLLVELGSLSLAVAGSILGAGILWYVFRAKARVVRESALVRLAERIAEADFREHDVEAELAGIVRDRDQIGQDRFDRIVSACPVIDCPDRLSLDECLRQVGSRLAVPGRVDAEEAADLLARREALSSTVVRPGVAVPHVVSDDIEDFRLVILRCREGVPFGGPTAPVHAVFAVATPASEREFYLAALVAIAEVTDSDGFMDDWLAARGSDGLREVVLSAERERAHTPAAAGADRPAAEPPGEGDA
jgi:mannitol/fructose-specific phosphotransferase system IIA component (Ntr-type)